MAEILTLDHLFMALGAIVFLIGCAIAVGVYWLMIRPVFRWIRLRLWYLAKFLKLTKTDKPPLLWRFDKYSDEDCSYGLFHISTELYNKHERMNDTEYLARHKNPHDYWRYRSISEHLHCKTAQERVNRLMKCENFWSK